MRVDLETGAWAHADAALTWHADSPGGPGGPATSSSTPPAAARIGVNTWTPGPDAWGCVSVTVTLAGTRTGHHGGSGTWSLTQQLTC